VDSANLGKKLSKIVQGIVLWDNDSRNFYSVDASAYRLRPSVIVIPKNESDISKIVQFASKNHIPITPRGAGTGLVGGALGSGIILDMKNLDSIKVSSGYVQAGAGALMGQVDSVLEKNLRFLGPNPSSGAYCTIGGMIASNASGSRSLKYGGTIDNLIQVRLVTYSGKILTLPDGIKIKSKIPGFAKKRFPQVTKNSCGYRIDTIKTDKDIHKILAGSEGTLGIITSAKLKTYPIPRQVLLCILHYKTIMDAARDVPILVNLKPSAVELVDSNIARHMKIKTTKTGCFLLVEFDDNINDNKNKLRKFSSGKILTMTSDKNQIQKLWGFRNSALSYSFKSISGDKIMPSLVEDATVPVRRLPLLLKLLEIISKKYHIKMIIYGHAGNGNLHVRPILSKKNLPVVKKIANEFFTGVIGIGGSITGEHGDGLARSEFVRMQYGDQVYSVFKKIKKEFDPKNIFNPGKVISKGSTVTRNLK